jgi:hypothetical protein
MTLQSSIAWRLELKLFLSYVTELFGVSCEMCSERASETNNAGQKLRDGANINRSLLALANCINALGKQQKKGLAYVPYRNRYNLINPNLARNFYHFTSRDLVSSAQCSYLKSPCVSPKKLFQLIKRTLPHCVCGLVADNYLLMVTPWM